MLATAKAVLRISQSVRPRFECALSLHVRQQKLVEDFHLAH
jgi:hypothetical protein